jgi:signal transduction histidine kinase
VGVGQVGGTYAAATHHSLSISAGGFVLLVAGAGVLVGRRRFPVAVLAATYATTLGYLATGNPSGAVWLSVIVAFGTAIYLRKRVAAVTFLIAGYVGLVWVPVIAHARNHQPPTATFSLAMAAGLVVLLAASEGIRLQRQRAAALTYAREQEVLRRVSEERLRIAHDLHDVIAHSIAVINVQANTALHLMDRQPERARSALTTINEVSKQALAEVRTTLGILRQPGEDAPLAPTPTLTRLDDLIARAGEAGLRVRVHLHGEPDCLPGSVDMAAYRIVQEALTNTARHAPGAAVTVRIDYHPDALAVRVDDDGTELTSTLVSNGLGVGIVGMTERAHALGGTLEAGPRPGGGFEVHAVFPLREQTP